MRRLVFYNNGHIGDIFVTKQLVVDIKQQLPSWDISFAHVRNRKILADIVPLTSLEEAQTICPDPNFINTRLRLSADKMTFYVNTWIAAYQYSGLWPTPFQGFGSGNPGYLHHHRVIEECYNNIKHFFGMNLTLNPDVWFYVPDIDYSYYDLTVANDFVAAYPNIYLFCNGFVGSGQSEMTNMKDIIETLAARHRDAVFVATEKFSTDRSNIKFTDDIFQTECDICEISYLSTRAKIIVGKNSGPFSYSSTRRNLCNTNKIFVDFSKYAHNTMTYGLNFSADYRFSNTVHSHYALEILEQAIEDARTNNQISGFKYV